jgi:hypothetical protein
MINRNKTEGLRIGKLKHSKDKEENIKWTSKPIKSLGIYYGQDYTECEKLNWEYFYTMCLFIYFYLNTLDILIISYSKLFDGIFSCHLQHVAI